ncbi:MAG: HAD-IIB family hydrolase [bacterium]
MAQKIIFTDLDGTLLNYEDYSFEAALPALTRIREKRIPLVICSSKTRKEIEYYRKKLGNDHPFISENGGGIFIPQTYFDFSVDSSRHPVLQENGYRTIMLGAPYAELRKAIQELREEGFPVRGFGDISIEELCGIASLSSEEAAMAKERDFDEPFLYDGPGHELPRLLKRIREKGFKFTEGRFLHILGNSNKGLAISILIDLYKKAYGAVETIALGDSPNDLPMLSIVGHPVLVKKPDGTHDPRIMVRNLIKAEGVGPEGWNEAVMHFISP